MGVAMGDTPFDDMGPNDAPQKVDGALRMRSAPGQLDPSILSASEAETPGPEAGHRA